MKKQTLGSNVIIVESKAVIGLLNIKEFDKFNKTREKITKTINDHINIIVNKG